MPPRPRVEWMVPADDRILDTLAEIAPLAMSPAGLAFATEYEQSYVARRCRELANRGLIDRPGDKMLYRITELGERYLSGEVEPTEYE